PIDVTGVLFMRLFTILFLITAIVSSAALGQMPAKENPSAATVTKENPSADSANSAEFNRLREEGNTAVYNIDYKLARERFQQMVKIAPEHPAGYIYLANNLWLEWLNSSRRLLTSLYNGASFYQQDAEEDKFDPKRDKEFNDLLKEAITVAKAR